MSFYWENSVFAIIAFTILFLVLKKYAFGPLFGVMEKRSDLIQEQLKTAETNRKEAEELLKDQKQAIQDARNEAYEILEQSRKMSSKQADDLLEQAREEAVRIKEDALKDIENEKNKAITALRSQVSSMSVLIASKIIEKQIDEKANKQLIDQYLEEVGDNL